MSRIHGILVSCIAVLSGGAPSALADDSRPNIVFIFSDDHAWQAISAYGEERKLVETPHIDRLAREGMRFDRCLVPNSICGPSRATVLTGKYSHRNGFYNNANCRFDGSQTTFPKLLQSAGYQTAMIGKWHLGSEPTGFDEWHILPGQGVYYNPPMIRNGESVKHRGYVTDLIADFSLRWLRERDKSKPFLLMCQHKAPHREWSPALRHLGHDGDRRYPEPDTLFDDYANRGEAVRNQDMTLRETFQPFDAKFQPPPGIDEQQLRDWNAYYQPRNEAFERAELKGDDLVRWRYNRYMHDYLGCVKGVDEAVGRVLKFLDDENLTENTLVIYASDQGFFLGEHGWFDKRWIFEESLRTPLLIRWPGKTRPGSVNGQLTSIVDIAQTVLEVAAVAPLDDKPAQENPVQEMQGSSLVPLLKGESPPSWRTGFYYHYYEYPIPHRVLPHYGLVTDRYKLVHFYHGERTYWELYDRERDPRELRDFYSDPQYTAEVKDLHEKLAAERTRLQVPEETPLSAFGNPPK